MKSPQLRCVIVGGGHAAAQLCASLVQSEWPGRITVLSDELHLPYHRPPLSKTYLCSDPPESVQLIRPESFYRDHSVEVRLGARVDSIDRASKRVWVGDQTLAYDYLTLATGSTHLRPPISGIDHPRVMTLQTAAQADALRSTIQPNQSVVVIGAGFIGLEVAASLRKLGIDVTVLERMPRVLSRVTSPDVSTFFENLHRRHGVNLHTSVEVASVTETLVDTDSAADGTKQLVVCARDGQSFPADFVVVGAGAAPNIDLASQAGLDVDDGVLVNEFNQTSDSHVYAMGDCCNQWHRIYEQRLRLESVQNALDQAKVVAASIAGQPLPGKTLPWFWSDQYDVKLQIAGISTGYDECLIRGDASSGEPFSAWYFRGDRLLAVDAINDARAYAVASKLIPSRSSPLRHLIPDPRCTAKELLQSAQQNNHA